MNFLYRNLAPIYKGPIEQPTQASGGFLPGIAGGLFGGGGQPAYRQRGGDGAPLVAHRSWWQWLSATPQYRTAPVRQCATATAVAEFSPYGCADADANYWRQDWRRDEKEEDEVTTALREIHIW